MLFLLFLLCWAGFSVADRPAQSGTGELDALRAQLNTSAEELKTKTGMLEELQVKFADQEKKYLISVRSAAEEAGLTFFPFEQNDSVLSLTGLIVRDAEAAIGPSLSGVPCPSRAVYAKIPAVPVLLPF